MFFSSTLTCFTIFPIVKLGIPASVSYTHLEVELCKLEHGYKGNVFRAEAQIQVKGKLLRAESTMDDLRKAIVDVKDSLQVQIKKYRETR